MLALVLLLGQGRPASLPASWHGHTHAQVNNYAPTPRRSCLPPPRWSLQTHWQPPRRTRASAGEATVSGWDVSMGASRRAARPQLHLRLPW